MATTKRILNTSPYRVLLSDVLPYEVPMFFTMRNFYRWADRVKLRFADDNKTLVVGRRKYVGMSSTKEFLDIINGSVDNPKHSYSFYINKDGKETGRELTLIHPYDAMRMVFFYKDCDGQIINSCRRSQFSLRYPHHVAISVNVRKPLVPTLVKKYTSYKVTEPKTYFAYKDYRNINSFYNGKQFLRLQSQYRKFYKSDIHHCFDTIPADKLYEAAYLTSSPAIGQNNFASKFYGIMKGMRTKDAGIIIGPEFSRLYAEIILQRIDNEIMSDMERAGLKLHHDYECFRYLDDIFFFYDSDKTLELFKKIYSNRLMNWGMEPNEIKKDERPTPFIAPQTIAKNEIEALIKDTFHNQLNNFVAQAVHHKVHPVPYSINANDFYKQLLTIINKNNIELSKVSSYLLARFQKEFLQAIDEFDDLLGKYLDADENELLDVDGRKNFKNYATGLGYFLRQLLRLAFLIFESDIRMSTSIKVVMIVDSIIQYANRRLFIGQQTSLSVEIRNSIYKFVRDELTHLLKVHKLRQMNGLEICNLMTIMSDLTDGYALSNAVLNSFINRQFDINDQPFPHGANFLMAFALLRALKPSNMEIENTIVSWLKHRLDIKQWDINDAECCYILLGVANLLSSSEKKAFNNEANAHNLNIDKIDNRTSAFMQWTGVSLQKACSEKVAADVY